MIDKSAYMLRISQAGPVQMVVINFELVLEFLNLAQSSIQENNTAFRENIQKAKNGLEQLISSLDFDIALSHDFHEIYSYIYKHLSDIHFTRDNEKATAVLHEMIDLVEILLAGWRDASDKNPVEPTTNGDAPKVYSGLTYGRDGQAQEYMEDEGKGYMA